MQNLELVERQEGQTHIVEVVGELTVVGGEQQRLLARTRALLDGGARLLLINLARCRRVDSSGLGELVTCLVTASKRGAHFRLSAVPPQIRGLMKIANLHQLFEFFDSDEDALAAPPAAP